ncbi:MAG: hypothetical protein ABW133_17700 [Polyangiaceae bacterium]
MTEGASRWALLASLALHVAAFGLTLVRPARTPAPLTTLTDFWAGTTFEVPDFAGDVAFSSAASEAVENSNEINVDGVDPSSHARSKAAAQGAANANTLTNSAPPEPGGTTSAPGAAGAKGKNANRHARADSRAATSASGGPSSAGATGSAAAGTFGGEGAAAGVRDLVRSFVRAMPLVASSDPVWSSLPLGPAGSAELTLGLNGEGKPFAAQPLESAPAHLRRLVQKTLSVMAGGRFAPPPSDLPAAEQKLRIAVALTQQEAPQGDVGSGGAFALRFEPADAQHVSRAFFTLASGRRVEVSVRQLSLH